MVTVLAQTECFDFSELSDFPDNWIYGYAIPVPIQTIRSCYQVIMYKILGFEMQWILQHSSEALFRE
jgi:hypothetical protein